MLLTGTGQKVIACAVDWEWTRCLTVCRVFWREIACASWLGLFWHWGTTWTGVAGPGAKLMALALRSCPSSRTSRAGWVRQLTYCVFLFVFCCVFFFSKARTGSWSHFSVKESHIRFSVIIVMLGSRCSAVNWNVLGLLCSLRITASVWWTMLCRTTSATLTRWGMMHPLLFWGKSLWSWQFSGPVSYSNVFQPLSECWHREECFPIAWASRCLSGSPSQIWGPIQRSTQAWERPIK